MVGCANELLKMFNQIFHRLESDLILNEEKENRENTNRAVQMFSEHVIENREKLTELSIFELLPRTYVNIMTYVHGQRKPKLKQYLASFNWLDDHTKDKIYRLSFPGRYQGINQGMDAVTTTACYHQDEFFNLIEEFTTPSGGDGL